MKCAHSSVRCERIGKPALLEPRGGFVPPGTVGMVCHECGDRLSLEPSNDDSPAVQIEMRAVELHQSWVRDVDAITGEEYAGWLARYDDNIPLDSAERLAGWLSLEMHHAGTERDIGTWHWDPSRPLAEQFAETERDDVAADAMTWSCPAGSSECEIRRECTNKCGQKDTQAEIDAKAEIEEARSAAMTAALVADLNAKGPAHDAINDAFDAMDNEDGAP